MPKRWCRSIRRSCPIRQTNLGLVSFRLCHGLLDFSAALRALVDEVDLRHAPMGFNIANVHSKTHAVGADDCGGLNFVVLDVGWHVGSPSRIPSGSALDPKASLSR